MKTLESSEDVGDVRMKGEWVIAALVIPSNLVGMKDPFMGAKETRESGGNALLFKLSYIMRSRNSEAYYEYVQGLMERLHAEALAELNEEVAP